MNIRSLLMIGILLLHGAAAYAEDGCCSCPECGAKVCVAKPVTKSVKKTVYSVEKKDICIPRFRFPWQMKKGCGGACDANGCDSSCDSAGCGNGCNDCGCPPKCGRVKTVKVLKKKSIECKKCGYEWEIRTVESVPCEACGPGRGLGLRGGFKARICDSNSCDSGAGNSGACDASYFNEAPQKDAAPAKN